MDLKFYIPLKEKTISPYNRARAEISIPAKLLENIMTNRQKKINNKEETTVTGKSRTTAGRGIIIGNSSADTPTIIRILKILLPMTLPKAIDDVPFTAEAKLTKNSGADVPNATTVSPMTICDILSLRAILAALSVKQSAPHNTPTIPASISSID